MGKMLDAASRASSVNTYSLCLGRLNLRPFLDRPLWPFSDHFYWPRTIGRLCSVSIEKQIDSKLKVSVVLTTKCNVLSSQ